MRRKSVPEPRQPGEQPAATERSDDAAIEAGRSGKAHRVGKHPDPASLARSTVAGDPDRAKEAPVNAQKEMMYAGAMKELEAGTLERSVLTEQGWVVVPKNVPAAPKA